MQDTLDLGSNVSSYPYFEFNVPRNVTTAVGQTAFLHCRVQQLGDKAVSLSSMTLLFDSRRFKFQKKILAIAERFVPPSVVYLQTFSSLRSSNSSYIGMISISLYSKVNIKFGKNVVCYFVALVTFERKI